MAAGVQAEVLPQAPDPWGAVRLLYWPLATAARLARMRSAIS